MQDVYFSVCTAINVVSKESISLTCSIAFSFTFLLYRANDCICQDQKNTAQCIISLRLYHPEGAFPQCPGGDIKSSHFSGMCLNIPLT